MTPAILCLKALDGDRESWSFCWFEGSPTGSMLQEANGWLDGHYQFSVVCALVWGITKHYPHYRFTFNVVVPQAPLAAD